MEKQYLDLCRYILKHGKVKDDRTGTGTISVFGHQMRYDLSEGFPLLTSKRVPFRVVAEELKWFLQGNTNIKYLVDNNVNIWNEDAYRWYKKKFPTSDLTLDGFVRLMKDDNHFARINGNLGNIYGKQWRRWGDNKIDQIHELITELMFNPDSRRLMVNSWNVDDLEEMALPPCHYGFQCYVVDGKLSLMWQQRSVDVFLGLPFNIASYAILTHLLAHITGLQVGELIFTGGDVHIYSNHIEQIEEQLSREPRELPKLKVNSTLLHIDDFMVDDLSLTGYDPHPPIIGKVSVGK